MKNFIFALLIICIPILSNAQQTINGSIIHDNLQRDYILYVPDSYSSDVSAPLILNFHGYTSNAYEQMWYGDFRSIADTAGFLLVHPMGTEDAAGNTHWNVGWGGSTVDDVGFTEALIDSLALDYNIDIERVFSTGMSNGGFMSYKLACDLSNRIAAIASVTGSMNLNQPNSCFPQHPTPIMEIHGTADLVVPYDGASWIESIVDILSYWADFNNCDLDPIITDIPDSDPNDGSTVENHLYSNGNNGVEVEHFKIINGAHTWPGNAIGGSGTNYDINASVEIWKFFSRYDINGLIIPTNIEPLSEVSYDINIYPNPTKSIINIELDINRQMEFQLFTTIGKSLFRGKINTGKHQIDISELPKGMYLLKIGDESFKILKTE